MNKNIILCAQRVNSFSKNFGDLYINFNSTGNSCRRLDDFFNVLGD